MEIHGYKPIKHWDFQAVLKQVSLSCSNSSVSTFLAPIKFLILTAGAAVVLRDYMVSWNRMFKTFQNTVCQKLSPVSSERNSWLILTCIQQTKRAQFSSFVCVFKQILKYSMNFCPFKTESRSVSFVSDYTLYIFFI